MQKPTMTKSAFVGLGRSLVAASHACGIDHDRVKAIAPGVAEVIGTGVSVFWAHDAFEGAPGWLIRETYKLHGKDAPPVSQTVAAMPEAEFVRAAKCALLLVVEKRLDAAIAEAA